MTPRDDRVALISPLDNISRITTDLPVVLICRSVGACRVTPKHFRLCKVPPHQRGVSRSSRTLGAGCGGRFGAARRTRMRRTAKSCGPHIPTLM